MSGLVSRARRLSRRGPAYLVHLALGVALPRLCMATLRAAQLHRRSRRLLTAAVGTLLAAALGRLAAGRPGAALAAAAALTGWGLGRTVKWFGARLREAGLAADHPPLGGEIERLGEIDNDGRLAAESGDHLGLPTVEAAAFTPRYRFDLTLSSLRDRTFVRKDYRGDRAARRREEAALERLAASGVAPALLAVDRRRQLIDKSFVEGPTLRDLMVGAGARILSSETEREEALAALDARERLEIVWRRGRAVLDELGSDLLADLEAAMTVIHSRGVTGFSLTFGNVVLDRAEGRPVFIDFDSARVHRRAGGASFHLARDRDRVLFNRIYGADIETETSVAEALTGPLATGYAPLDLGRGLVTRGFWSVDSGTGRWEYLNRAALGERIAGRRILDLGAHNGVMSLMMLRDGARSVIAVEREAGSVAAARRLHRVVEWRDMRRYALEVRHGDMRRLLDEDWGTFDVVTAFCSLYYLSAEEMGAMLRRLHEVAPLLVLQAKSDTRAEAADDKARKSSPEFLRALCEVCGWSLVGVHNRPGYSRPLLVAASDRRRRSEA